MATSPNSSVAGYLQPAGIPAYDNALDDILHDIIVGITQLPNEMVRPRVQPEPPNIPSFTENWCAFGVMAIPSDTFAYEKHDPAVQGSSEVQRDEQLNVLLSFYGANALQYALRWKSGLSIGQNRDGLRAAGMDLIEVQDAILVPALIKEKWVRRADIRTFIRRRTAIGFNILNLESANGTLDTEALQTTINVTNP